ncbi:unnamed protein product [Triticum turgidum subsp. durum]|uniref:RRM domain-containing protein n=1 Tax=Triticum turgidum subsp. durum TaxID=4567 RepID=A0A9R0TNT5_TRITD|nr:unnamed protein product [Triticum turgidum subsp. durum]
MVAHVTAGFAAIYAAACSSLCAVLKREKKFHVQHQRGLMVGYVGRSDPIHVQAAAMEPAELAKIIFSRVQEVEPDNVSKIVGCILLREPDEDELVYTDGVAVDHHVHGGATPGPLESLEIEITELLHSRRGQPVSIASLPTLYGEKYGKGLQADGYLTESQRHGKAGFSLTKLLSRLNKIRVIERPHGQHSVVLAEDAAKYSDCRSDRGGEIPASSHQIYLTFPSDSNFTEDDVANYFGQYGPVRDVRIPCQDQRMFGFVSFQNPETVTALLMRCNPHFICGSRVLAKAYREKTKCINERTNNKSTTHCYPPRWIETDPEFYPDQYDSPRLERRQLARDRQQLLELERRHLAGLRVVEPQCAAYFDCSIGDVAPFNSHSQSQSQSAGSKEVGRTMDPLSTADQLDDIVSTSQSQAPPIQANNNYDDQESNQIELLPESPFASSAPTGNGI